MKIRTIRVDGFGVWTGLKLTQLGDGLNVVYGPNEAGKTTLLQFLRSILYGFSTERRHYLPPSHGGEPGGALALDGPHGEYIVQRHGVGGELPRGELTLLGPDGSRQGDHFLGELLSNVDEAIFNNVFAVSLQELQELGALSATEAADQLYRITAGMDRVSVVEVMRELNASRQRIISSRGEPCQISHLLAERAKLQAELEDIAVAGQRYGRLTADQQQLQRNIARLEENRVALDHEARLIELALAVRDRWHQRGELDQRLTALGPVRAIPAHALPRLDTILRWLENSRDKIRKSRQEEARLQAEAKALPINESLWRQAPRIEALNEQQAWIKNLQQQIAVLEKETAGLEIEMQSRRKKLGAEDRKMAEDLPPVTRRVLAMLRPLASVVSECRRQQHEAEQALATAQQKAQSLDTQMQAALSSKGERNLAEALDRHGNEVAQYRRRQQIDERLAQISHSRNELEAQARDHFDRQLMPTWVLVGAGLLLMAGAVLVVLGLMLSTTVVVGPPGWALLILGVACGVGVITTKLLADQTRHEQFDVCQKQIFMLEAQARQVKKERDSLDRQIASGGDVKTRLEKAEQQLAALEELVPLDAQRLAALQEVESIQRRVAQAKNELATARKKWQNGLAAAHLPTDLRLQDVQQLALHSNFAAEHGRRVEKTGEDHFQRQRELEGVTARIRQLVADTGIKVSSSQPLDQLQALLDALALERTRVERRESILKSLREQRHEQAQIRKAIQHHRARRHHLLQRVGARTRKELVQLADLSTQAEKLRQQRETLHREITAALVGHSSEDAIGPILQSDKEPKLQAVRDDLLLRIDAVERELSACHEQRGRLAEQMRPWVEDRRLAEKKLDLAVLDKRLYDAAQRWRVLATTNRVLDSICGIYERERQPETLREASVYLAKLTQDRYVRVWTTLGERTLLVDDAAGHTLNVDVLSRGTREQLFLSLRMALAAAYLRRGMVLPLILDDVLVNFDAQRAKAAATLLRDFSAQGHQVLIFTCHDHIFRLFKSLHVSAVTLPDNSQPGQTLAMVEQEEKVEEKEKERKASRRRPAKPPEPPEVEAEEYEWEEAVDDESEAA